MPLVSILSAGMARQLMTGIGHDISRGRERSSIPALRSQRQPTMEKPDTYAPSREWPSTSLTDRFVMSVWITSLSSSRDWRCAVCCAMAVKKDWGLIMPESHVTLGISRGLAAQSDSWLMRSCQSCSHVVRLRRDGHASFAHDDGTRPRKSALMRSSIWSDTVSSPAKPMPSSVSERRTSSSSRFICSHSSVRTFWKGPFSSPAPNSSSS
mmetsp:Transcript_13430/g.18360  ORF Transcript_13430/g.18360 Transcript_13430/m.18360 type:complete len:210 (+) Transcript_13430:192-821(+)